MSFMTKQEIRAIYNTAEVDATPEVRAATLDWVNRHAQNKKGAKQLAQCAVALQNKSIDEAMRNDLEMRVASQLSADALGAFEKGIQTEFLEYGPSLSFSQPNKKQSAKFEIEFEGADLVSYRDTRRRLRHALQQAGFRLSRGDDEMVFDAVSKTRIPKVRGSQMEFQLSLELKGAKKQRLVGVMH